jgi:hypothetical protein
MSTNSVFSSAAQILSRPGSSPVYIVLNTFAQDDVLFLLYLHYFKREQIGLIIIMWLHAVKVRQHFLKMLRPLLHLLLHDR